MVFASLKETDGKFYWVDGTANGAEGVVEAWEENQPV